MRKIALFAFAAIISSLFAGSLSAQVLEEETNNLDGFYEKVHDNNRKPVEFPYVRADDIAWTWRIWRIVDLREKMNQVFYYPIVPDQGRVNLFYALENAILEGKIKIYKDDMFKEESDWLAMKASLELKTTTTVDSVDIDGGIIEVEKEVSIALKNEDIKTLRIKEDWFIDKNRTVQDVRIIGFAPIYYQVKEEGAPPLITPLFWVRYNDPEVRELLANTEVYNFRNDKERRSYDDIFQKRYFNSYIIRESNVYNRSIRDYTIGEEALAESENIKEKIFNMEEDMWEY